MALTQAQINQLSSSELVAYNAMGPGQQSALSATTVNGPLILQDAGSRIMTGAVNSTHASEQVTATASQDLTRPIKDTGKHHGSAGRNISQRF